MGTGTDQTLHVHLLFFMPIFWKTIHIKGKQTIFMLRNTRAKQYLKDKEFSHK